LKTVRCLGNCGKWLGTEKPVPEHRGGGGGVRVKMLAYGWGREGLSGGLKGKGEGGTRGGWGLSGDLKPRKVSAGHLVDRVR